MWVFIFKLKSVIKTSFAKFGLLQKILLGFKQTERQ